MAAEKFSKRTLSGWVDEAVPAERLRRELKDTAIDADSFIAWLAPQLGRFRDEMRARGQMPTRTDERDFLRDLHRRSDELRALLTDLPPRTGAALHRVHGHGLDLKRLSDDLVLLATLCRQGAAVLSASPARPGRKRATPRDDLLAAVVNRLRKAGIGVRKSRELATDVLSKCGVPAPVNERALGKTARARGA